MKVLIVRFSSIGDIVLTTPVIRCLKEQLGAEVHFLTKSTFKDVLIANPNIKKIHLFDNNWDKLLPILKEENFDFIIDLHHNLRTRFLKSKLSVKHFSFDKLNFKKWLMVNLKINLLPQIHIVDRYLATVKHLGVLNDHKGLDYFIKQEDEIDLKSLPIEFHNGYVGLVIGAQHFSKRLPLNKLKEICEKIELPIILIGGPTDSEIAKELVNMNVGEINNACGLYNLNQSASLIKQANFIIAHDTGLMHIAAAFNKVIHTFWGNTIPEFGMDPYMVTKKFNYEVPHLNCRPCSKIGYNQCPKKHFNCMNQQSIEQLLYNIKS